MPRDNDTLLCLDIQLSWIGRFISIIILIGWQTVPFYFHTAESCNISSKSIILEARNVYQHVCGGILSLHTSSVSTQVWSYDINAPRKDYLGVERVQFTWESLNKTFHEDFLIGKTLDGTIKEIRIPSNLIRTPVKSALKFVSRSRGVWDGTYSHSDSERDLVHNNIQALNINCMNLINECEFEVTIKVKQKLLLSDEVIVIIISYVFLYLLNPLNAIVVFVLSIFGPSFISSTRGFLATSILVAVSFITLKVRQCHQNGSNKSKPD